MNVREKECRTEEKARGLELVRGEVEVRGREMLAVGKGLRSVSISLRNVC